MHVGDALKAAAALGVARIDAQLLLLHALGRADGERAWLLAHDADELSGETDALFRGLCARRVAGEPVAYLIGHKEFFGLDLRVDARVLVPRPETETLVEWALQVLGDRAPDPQSRRGPPSVLDLGTGSGAIAVAIKYGLSGASVTAVDASAPALEVARSNAARLGLGVTFVHGSWFSGVSGRFDVIVSNPPYIATGDPHLSALAHEPQDALVSGADGLDAMRAIVRAAPAHLASGGWLLLEHGHDQAAAVRALLQQAGFTAVESRRDLAGIERCTSGKMRALG